jgi:hypothetical protein
MNNARLQPLTRIDHKITALPLKPSRARRINWRYNIALFVMIAAFIIALVVMGNLLEGLV